MSNPYNSPTAKKKQGYEDYNLSPPKLRKNKQQTFDEAVAAIQRDWNKELRVEWDGRKVMWFQKKEGKELHVDVCRVLLFLYSRSFKKNESQASRRKAVSAMIKNMRVMGQVMACDGDIDLSSHENSQDHYIRACLTIHRYFRQSEATGFVRDMSSLRYYLRTQKYGSCFLQAPCVAMSYFLQACGESLPPVNASRLIRHHFTDEQLIKYVKDDGGDSVGVFKILEATLFECHSLNRDPNAVNCNALETETWANAVRDELSKNPALLSKFVCCNFYCSELSREQKQQFPHLSRYDKWSEIPAGLIPPGVARFTTWGRPAEFVPLNTSDDAEGEESELTKKWRESLMSSEDVDRSTDMTASLSTDSADVSRETISERSTSRDASMSFDSDSGGYDWSEFFCDDEDDTSSTSQEEYEAAEGGDDAPLHAMVLLGYRIVDGTECWVLQNSLEGPMQIIEVSTEYLIKSDARLYFYNQDTRSPKARDELEINTSGLFCPSPIAESSPLERSDCETWTDSLAFSEPPEEEDVGQDDVFDDW